MKNYNTILNHFYDDADLVCVATIPDFAGRKQRFCRVADLKTEKWIKFLKAANAKNSNIYLSVYTFLHPQRTEDNVVELVDRIFLDFDIPGTYEKFRQDYEPTVTVATSPGKYQCFLKLSEPVPKIEAKAISRTLARQYNADHTFDLARIFRLPNFRNVKYPERPLATISGFNPQTTYNPYNLPCEEELTKSPAGKQGEEQKKDISNIVPAKNNSTSSLSLNRNQYDYSHFLENAPLKTNGEPDLSSADFSYAVYLLSQSFDSEDVRDILQAESPSLSKRKGSGIDNYLNKTVSRAKEYQEQNYKPYEPRR
jgi:hypothetical protein